MPMLAYSEISSIEFSGATLKEVHGDVHSSALGFFYVQTQQHKLQADKGGPWVFSGGTHLYGVPSPLCEYWHTHTHRHKYTHTHR